MRIGIVGAEGAKFTKQGEVLAREAIRSLLCEGDTVVSGGCHLGGVDIWAEEIATIKGLERLIFPPEVQSWEDGYKPRNILIAEHSDYLVSIVVNRYPSEYRGMTFDKCYHCHTVDHIKSGGCWTVKYGRKIGIPGEVMVITQ